jgi:2-oxo-4-hydroxy-4-carboxy-5-ureidoimidazoline decarboxylase
MTTRGESSRGGLGELNGLPREAAVEQFLSVCSSHRWAASMADSRPFGDMAQLQRTAESLWLGLGPGEWLEGLAGHPRIGERGGAAEEHSRREQAGMNDASETIRAAIAAGNREYEERFGHVFLIAAAGRRPEEVLGELTRRLDNTPEEELRVAAAEHVRITRLRLERMIG